MSEIIGLNSLPLHRASLAFPEFFNVRRPSCLFRALAHNQI
jgi:hypothetical protein